MPITCKVCEVKQSKDNFSYWGHSIRSVCRDCTNKRRRELRKENPEEAKAQSREASRKWRERHPEDGKEYRKNWHLLKKYNITIKDYDTMLAKQDNRCAMCGTDKAGGNQNIFHVDHDHDTGEVRGLLCINCNIGIGYFKDSIERLEQAINYLNNYYANY